MCLPGTVEVVRERADGEGLPKVSRRALLGSGAAAVAVASLPKTARARRSRQRTRDLTHVFAEGFPVYTFDPPARRTLVTVENDGFYAQEWTFGEHSGTHMDAPGHFISGGRLTPDIRPRELLVPIVVIDISRRAASDPDARVEVEDLVRFERRHGRIPKRALVAMYSGWETRVGDAAAFRNADSAGVYHFPGFGLDAVQWLLERRAVTGIGVDTLSLDVGESQTFDVHLTLLGADRYGIENLANLADLPARGATAYVGVVPWEDGSGGPARVLATW